MEFYKFTYKDGSDLGTTADDLYEALAIAVLAPHQSRKTIDTIEIRKNKRWHNVGGKSRRLDDE